MKTYYKFTTLLLALSFLLSACVPTVSAPTDEVSITIDSPGEQAEVTSPIDFTGFAPGNWFFEAQAPIFLYTNDGTLLAQTTATVTNGDWMTSGQVPFEATIEFTVEEQTYGYIILQKDNPSGLPENDDSLKWDVVLMP